MPVRVLASERTIKSDMSPLVPAPDRPDGKKMIEKFLCGKYLWHLMATIPVVFSGCRCVYSGLVTVKKLPIKR